MTTPRLFLFLAALALCACGSPTGPTTTPSASVSLVVFYDENGNGVADPTEAVRIPNATVHAGSGSGRTDGAGRTTLVAPQGAATFTVDASSLPPGFVAAPVRATVPATGDIAVPATLPIGSNRPNTYMAVGDSITQFSGYPDALAAQLRAYFGAATPINKGLSSTKSFQGAEIINSLLLTNQPAYTLVMYGTNDWNEPECRNPDKFPCFTIDSLRYMVRGIKGSGSQAFLATIPPVNVGYNIDTPVERNNWVIAMNVLVRQLAAQEGAVLVDVEKVMLADPDQKSLFLDHIHPSTKGTGIIVQAFKDAITGQQPAGSSGLRSFFRLFHR